jgi:hypothetical protein
VKRREVLALVGGTAVWSFTARAQQSAAPVVGYLNLASPDTSPANLSAFTRGLAENGSSTAKMSQSKIAGLTTTLIAFPRLLPISTTESSRYRCDWRASSGLCGKVSYFDYSNPVHQWRRSGRGGSRT